MASGSVSGVVICAAAELALRHLMVVKAVAVCRKATQDAHVNGRRAHRSQYCRGYRA